MLSYKYDITEIPRGKAFFLRSLIMSARFAKITFFVILALLVIPTAANAQNANNGGNNGNNNGGNNGGNNGFNPNFGGIVGGIKIDTRGVLTGEKAKLDRTALARIEAGLKASDAKIAEATPLRMVSLRGLENAITKAKDEGKPLSSEITYMAGLQRVEYVIALEDKSDIIIAGPGEGYRLNDEGVVVGEKSGNPVIHLEDFLVAMRSVENARTGQGVSVSIDPTEIGIKQLQNFYGQLKRSKTPFRPEMQPLVEKAMGEQTIRLTGVPADSRFSQVLVAADYKMKRLGMGLEAAPISNFPSFMEMAQKAQVKNMRAAPRFWMECSYEPIAKNADGSIWQIRGKGVKTLTEDSKFDSQGKRSGANKPNRFAVKWAEMMTERFDELSAAEPVFRDLRNAMDLSVVAAIISRERLSEKVGLKTPAILGLTNAAVTPSYTVPKVVPAQCSFVRIAQSWLVSASGGIQLDSWGIASNTEVVPNMESIAEATATQGGSWWWNAASN